MTTRKVTVVNEYRIYVKGLFGRNRKVKGEGFELTSVDFELPILTDDELTPLVEAKLKEIKVKYGNVSISVNKVTHRKEYGYTTTEFTIFGSRTIKTLTVEAK